MFKHCWLLLFIALGTACAQFPMPQDSSASRPEILPPSAVSANTAVLKLYDTATEQRRAGALADAEATLERALRIEPRNGHLWLGLAELAASDDPNRARSLAERARSLAGGDSNLKAQAERLLQTL